MHNNKFYKKLNTLLDILILALPLIFIILTYLNKNYNPVTDFESFYSILQSMFGGFSPFGNCLYTLLSYLLGNSSIGSFYIVAIGIIDYMFIVWLLDIVKDLLMLIPTLVRKIGGE